MPRISFQQPNALATPTSLPDDMRRTLSQIRSRNNSGPQLQPGTVGQRRRIPRGTKKGDFGARISPRGLTMTAYLDNGTRKDVNLSVSSNSLQEFQSGTGAPTTAQFPNVGDTGWYRDTSGSKTYFVINRAGLIESATVSTLGINFTDIAGTVTAAQHSNFTAATANDSLHAVASSTHPGFMSTADKTKLDAAASTATASTMALRDGSANIAFNDVNAQGVYKASGTQVVSTRVTGWGTVSGTTNSLSYTTYTAPTIAGTYAAAQSDIQAGLDAVQDVSRRFGHLVTDLIAHGLIGA